ncbi:MAG: type I DNA topoisomerase [Actinobacteria bacterium]|nr:type I DNA topoisomerase [Actinomycetota bacterium]
MRSRLSKANSGQKLVIVESPAKAKTIEGYLGAGFTVAASVGHIRDLRSSGLAVDVDNDFAPTYELDDSKKAKIAELKKLMKSADELLLATDEDREGEAIAWHLVEALEPKIPFSRMVFNEITKDAIREALNHTRDLDRKLIDAQESRRIIDRLYGYEVSPVLWRKVQPGSSAGRVQSVATRLIVERERERMAFKSAQYWDISAIMTPGNFRAKLFELDQIRIASGNDFDDKGQLNRTDRVVLSEDQTNQLVSDLTLATFTVSNITEEPRTFKPPAPFITSTLQRTASSKMGWGSRRTMQIAQGLYERGYITYMRTDSTNLSEQATTAAQTQAREIFGAENVADVPRKYANKVKNAQEAHEAIRPAGSVFRTPAELQGEIRGDEFALYDLIWRRTLASQMADALGFNTQVRLETKTKNAELVFAASGTVITRPGFKAALDEVKEDLSDEEDTAVLPPLAVGDQLTATELSADGHSTKPPARYSEASLVKELEERGIGRPSTYASIIETIVAREYVRRVGKALVPTWLGFAVTRLLEGHFGRLVDYDFTAAMEEELDQIANGELDRLFVLRSFYFGDNNLQFPGLHPLLESAGEIDARANSTIAIDGTDITVRVGRYGPYVERGEERGSIPPDMAPDELTAEVAERLLQQKLDERELGINPETGRMIVAKAGRFGPYVTEVMPEDSTEKAPTASLFKSMDLSTLTLEQAISLLSLPRTVGVDPELNLPIEARNGKFGPYLTRGKDSRSLTSEEEIFTINLEQALAIYAQPKIRRGAQPKAPLKELGIDPNSEAAITLREGRFGLYVTDGTTNASLRSGDSIETIDHERAVELLSIRRAAGPAKKRTKKTVKKAVKKTAKPAKKTPAKKAKKSASKPKPNEAELVDLTELSATPTQV